MNATDDVGRPAATTTRRGGLRALAALLSAGLGLRLSGEASAAECGPCYRKVHGRCRRKRDNAPCRTNGRCLDGRCKRRPTCRGSGEPCAGGPTTDCCSGVCSEFCGTGAAGRPCHDDGDCISGVCIGYRCR